MRYFGLRSPQNCKIRITGTSFRRTARTPNSIPHIMGNVKHIYESQCSA